MVHMVKAVVMERIIVQILVIAWAMVKRACMCSRGLCVCMRLGAFVYTLRPHRL